jgi:copper homeostasis protein (lipoprotein)
MYRYIADAGLFNECLTRRQMPVAQEAANAALEAAYSMARAQAGEPLLVNIEGRIVERPRVEGSGVQSVVVVERFVNLWPGETCGVQFSQPPLEGTYWKLVRLGETAVVAGQRQREAHLVLDSAAHRVSGSTGCNRLTGSYRLDGQSLRFSQVAMTRMACDGTVAAIEQSFTKALDAARTWAIKGDHLELYGEGGSRAARFEARPINR